MALIAILCSSLQCNKDKTDPPTTLPPITQEGKNIFGCKVNGEVWVPYYKCGGSGNPCGELTTEVYRTNPSFALPLSFSIAVGRKHNSSRSFLIETILNQGISSTGNKIDSVKINYLSSNGGYIIITIITIDLKNLK